MLKKVELMRVEQGDEGTFGVLRLEGRAYCVTLEPPDRDNMANMSCIPAGHYMCRLVESPRFGRTFEVMNVPGRSHILLHPGNVVGDTRGCVLLGREFGRLRGDRAVLNSGKTFAGFLEQCGDVNEFAFMVTNAYEE
ncbi:DUF5675 family protein [Pseudodesulfovibrio piezophilus]|uniref:DUF5675 domain-containing protein n=1 Tax=Pseudodesulfovibrio piezophilus (strain DSM 21447 / JCM 15486 / C1TLV30) TaxID=1322246 RepID=M1WRJ6_PSEP2|nr:DUF5675 family protein [Pseudodesulfovibrio piezophilus]CCH49594.1 conserved protein of unknown function [Pseudodesulfovibrio piezophilus C1TLV30]